MESYKGKYFSILGDSISTLEGYSIPRGAEFYEGFKKYQANILTTEDTWWGQVITELGGKLLVNNSFSGSTVIKHPSMMIPSYGCSDERTSELHFGECMPDVVMVFLGTNDWGSGIKTKPENDGEKKESIFSCAYESMLVKLKKNYPEAELWCFTLPVSTCKKSKIFEFPYEYGGRHINEYCQVIRECGAKYGCKVIELYNYGEPHDTIDYFHPNREGMKTISDKIIKQIKGDQK